MRRNKLTFIWLVLALLAALCACSARGDDMRTEASGAPPQSAEQPQESSVAEEPDTALRELPNGWQLGDFTIAGFDREGPGDFGYRVTLDEGQLSRFAELLDLESWQELADPPEYGLTAALTLADEGLGRFLSVMDGGGLGAVIALSENGDSEKLVYTAPAGVVNDAKALADELKVQVEKTADNTGPASSEAFYPAAAAYREYDGSAIRGMHSWNEDGTLTFQHENTLTTLSTDNLVLENVTLPLEHLPADGGYDLTWSGSYILAIDRQNEESRNQFGAVCFTDDGGVHLANLTLFDRQGNLIRQYQQGDVDGYDESGEYVYLLPSPDGTEIMDAYYLADGSHTYWLDDETVIFECHSRIVFYDFAADTGRILDDMSELVDYHGKFGVYYGVGNGDILDGGFYYLAHRDNDKGNTAGTIWRADKNGAQELFGGKEFWHLTVGKNVLILSDHIDPSDQEADDRVYVADPDDGLALKEIWSGKPTIPFTDNGVVGFDVRNFWEEDGAILYAYDYRGGVLSSHSLGEAVQVDATIAKNVDGSLRYYYTLFEDGVVTDWAYDTATGITTELTEYGLHRLSEISFSPDEEHYVAYYAGGAGHDDESESPMLRVSRWEY